MLHLGDLRSATVLSELFQPHLLHRVLWGEEGKETVNCSEILSEESSTSSPQQPYKEVWTTSM